MWNRIGAIGIATILTLVVALMQLAQSNEEAKARDSAQATQITILEKQLSVQKELVPLQAVSSGSGPTATAAAARVAELEGTALALATAQAEAIVVSSITTGEDPQPSPTAEPITTSVWANEENGIQVDVNEPGMYNVAYIDDAYSPWPNAQYPDYRGWTTILRVYVNRPIEWGTTDYGLVGPINFDGFLGPGGYHLDKNEAIALSKGDSRNFRLNAGEYLILVTLDERGRYSDNQGKVDVEITYLGQ